MRPSTSLQRLDLRRRGVSLLLSLGLAALIVLALSKLGVLPAVRPEPSDTNAFSLSPVSEAGPRPAEAAGAERRAAARPAAPREEVARAEPQPTPSPRAPRPSPAPFPDMIILSRDQFAGSDIGRMRAGPGEGRGETASGGADSVAAYGPGAGPGGERLFEAEWQREPSDAELAGYLPPSGAPPGAWAVIACRTAPGFEVENCRSLGEAPAGSGLARAMRQAAWQFRVRPPRLGGRPLVGAWVRIRITFGRAP